MKEKLDALKGRKVIIYSRVSSVKQEGTLGDQIKTIKAGLKALGYKGTPSIYQEQVSGTKMLRKERPQLWAAMDEAMKSKRPAVIVVRDIQRFSRDPYHIGVLYQPLREKEIPVLSINEPIVLGTLKAPQPSSDLIAPIMISAGGSEVSTRKKQTIQGMGESKKKGISGGNRFQLHANEPLNPFREVGRMAGMNPTEAGRRIGMTKSWVDKQRIKQAKMTPLVLEQWLTAIEMIQALEREKGNGIGPRASVRVKAVRRMTGGFLSNPSEYTPVTQEMINEYFNNYNDYKPRKEQRNN